MNTIIIHNEINQIFHKIKIEDKYNRKYKQMLVKYYKFIVKYKI